MADASERRLLLLRPQSAGFVGRAGTTQPSGRKKTLSRRANNQLDAARPISERHRSALSPA